MTHVGDGYYWDFEVSETSNYCHAGVLHHNSGKTVAATAEISRIVRGRHPLFPKRNGIILCVGIDQNHIGQNMWEKLTAQSCFKVVPDEVTGCPRAVRPDPANPCQVDPIDMARQHLWKDGPPFLPPEEWDYSGGVAWEDKGANCPAIVNVRSTGWKMLWHPSGGNPRRGITIHAAWFDEEIAKRLWFTESMPRLLRHGGRFIWSATPQTGNEELLKLHRRFTQGDTDVFETQLLLEENPYITAEAKRRLYNSIAPYGEEELAVRYYGQWGVLSRQVYPQWDMNTLGVDGFTAA